jgi:hypothetical protein
MSTKSSTTADLTHRDRSVLRAVAAGRCAMSAGACPALTIDGLCCSDQFAGARLAQAGLIRSARGTVSLTDTGRAALGIAASDLAPVRRAA